MWIPRARQWNTVYSSCVDQILNELMQIHSLDCKSVSLLDPSHQLDSAAGTAV